VHLDDCNVHPTAVIEVDDLFLGAGTTIGAYARLEGTKVHLGRDSWVGDQALIGGGSSFDPGAFLVAGDFFHLGINGEVNTARGVSIGHEVGLGVQTRVFTHGVYLSALDGFPCSFEGVTIGDQVWIPNGQVNPGASLGPQSVYAPGSVISGVMPSNCLAGGNPAKVLRADHYPKELSRQEQQVILERISLEIQVRAEYQCKVMAQVPNMIVDRTVFNTRYHTIKGPATEHTELARHQLRRNGVRFRFEARDGRYQPWV